MSPNASELLTPDVRKKFLGDRASIWGVVAFFAGAVAVLVVIVFISPAVDNPARYEALRKKGRFAEAEIEGMSAAITEGSSRSRYWHHSRGRVISYRVYYHFSVGGKTYRGTHYVSASDVRTSGMREGAKFLALYDPKDPNNNVLTTMPASVLKGLEETGQTVESLRESVYIPRGGVPSWVLLLLYFLFVAALGGGGYWIWRRIKAGRIFSSPVAVPALLTDREVVTTRTRTSGGYYRERLSGYKMRVRFVSHAGASLELSYHTKRRGEAAALRVGSVVTVIYEEARPRNFLIYELYGDRVVEWNEEELRAKMGGLYDLHKKRQQEEAASIEPGRYGLGHLPRQERPFISEELPPDIPPDDDDYISPDDIDDE